LIKHSLLENMQVMLYLFKCMEDIIFGSNNNSMCEEFVATMQGEFEMSMIGELTY